jgi:hypothetical protein
LKNFHKIADYGGGSGATAKIISEHSRNVVIDIIDPFYSRPKSDMGKIRYIKNYDGQYDLIIFQDVLEHMENPLSVLVNIKSKQIEEYHRF